MLKLEIPAKTLWDERTETFIESPSVTLELEHSLVALMKWEAKWKKSFLDTPEKTLEETLDYVRCMSLQDDVDPAVFLCLDINVQKKINDYINDSMTATTFTEHGRRPGGKASKTTAEVIYYWMVELGIPFECQYWHLNQLMTLIRVCNDKKAPKQKMKGAALAKHNTSLNQARRKAHHSRG